MEQRLWSFQQHVNAPLTSDGGTLDSTWKCALMTWTQTREFMKWISSIHKLQLGNWMKFLTAFMCNSSYQFDIRY